MTPRTCHRLAQTGAVAALVLFVVLGAVTVAAQALPDLSWGDDSPNADTCPVVSEPGDSGLGTLRDCLETASTGDTITFDPTVFPPGSPVSIMLATALPPITAGELTIDASNAGVILDGSGLSEGNGLQITSSGNVVQGLHILHFPENGVQLGSEAHNNLIGGINSTPGGPCSGQCNVISGNGWLDLFHDRCGVLVLGTGNTVSGNYIGTDMTGTQRMPNHEGVHLWEATGNTVGGEVEGSGNLISGNDHTGVWIWRGSSNHVVGNLIGTDASGRSCLWNLVPVGIYFDSSDNIVESNVITGEAWGIQLANSAPIGNIIRGNWIGTNAHDDDLGNGMPGIALYDGNQTVIGPGNVIRYNDMEGIEISYYAQDTLVISNDISLNEGAGVQVRLADSLRNTIRENSIYDNGGLGIDLVDGGNTELPAPIIEEYDLAAGIASGSACANCTVWLFSDEYGEGQWCEASAEADGSGRWSINKGSAFIGPELTATATDSAGNTSEFGQDWPGEPPPPPLISAPVCGVTNQPQPLFAGFAQMGSTVRVGSAALDLGQTTTDDRNRWWLSAGQTLAEGSHVITATATTSWGTSSEAGLGLTVDSDLCFDPVGVTLTQVGTVQHPRDQDGCVDPAHDLEIVLWPAQLVTIKVPVRDASAEVYIEVNSIRYDLSDPDADGVFTVTFAAPPGGASIIALSADCSEGDDTMLIGATIDPDGYLYNADITASTGVTYTIPGVTVTLYVSDTVRARWLQWNAELYDQLNPQVTGDDGYFSFFTPPGDFRLVANGEAVGYSLYQSPVLTVVDEPIRHNIPLYFAQEIYLPLVMRGFP